MEFVWRIVGAISGATLVSAVIAIWALIKCLHDRANKDEWKSELAIAALGVLGVVLTIGSELASQDAEKRVGAELLEARKEIASLLEVNKEIASRVTYRSVMFTEQARKKFANVLATCPPASIGLTRWDGDAESRDFSDVIEGLLRSAGALGGRSSIDTGSVIPRPPGRILIQGIQGEESKDEVLALARVLTESGIQDVEVDPFPAYVILSGGKFMQISIRPK